jgi:predicted ester cyclase
MSDAVEAVERYDEAFNAQDLETRRDSLSENSELWMPGGMRLRGPDQILGVTQAFWGAIPDGTLNTERQFTDGTDVATEGRLVGTHTGPFPTPQGELPPTGNRVEFGYVSLKRVEGGKIVSEHLYFDQMEFLQQIGALPPSEKP